MYPTDQIPVFERAPVTDHEWAIALADYGLDRDTHTPRPPIPDSVPSSTGVSSSSSQVPSPRHTSPPIPIPSPSRPPPTPSRSSSRLVHSADFVVEGDDPTMRLQHASSRHHSDHSPTTQKPANPFVFFAPRPEPPVHNSQFGESQFNGELALPSDPISTSNQPLQTYREDRNGGGGAADPQAGPSATPMTFNIAQAMRMPRPRATEDGDDRTGDEERARLRHLYEQEGWLRGPMPAKATLIKRNKAIRTLGLVENDAEEGERIAVMRKYAELAKQIFQTEYAMVTILRGDEPQSYLSDAAHFAGTDPPWIGATDSTAAAHVMVRAQEERVFLIADASKDWRFSKMPNRQKADIKFYAAAPLIYTSNGSNDGKITFGMISILHKQPRDTFDRRERDILLNLANMLVYQLSTLQSEIMAKRYGSMYEQSIAFLRRSTLPDNLRRPKPEPEKKKQEKKAKPKPLDATPGRRESLATSRSLSPAPAIAPVEVAVKTAPKDSKRAKLHALEMDRALFTDSAATLRKVLGADAVATVAMDEYQLFMRKTTPAEPKRSKSQTDLKLQIIADFLQGKEWPADVDPVVQYVPRSTDSHVRVLGVDGDEDLKFHFDQPGAESTLADYLAAYLKTRKFWWDREDDDDDLTHRIMMLLPDQAQTTLATAFMVYSGSVKYVAFAVWRQPPSQIADSPTMALPFTWIMGGVTMAALAIRKVRSQEQSQITYSNLQAHELRTPLHQILAITQLLRSGMNDLADTPQDVQSSLTTTQQIRDFLPFLDAIDTSGKILHGIVDNILSFLDLKDKEDLMFPERSALLSSPTGAIQSLERMFEELIHEATEEDLRSRRSNGRQIGHVETVFEIISPSLGEQVTEDAGGALRKALSKILSNAYKFIDGQDGCVEIYVDDVLSLLPPEGCEDLSFQKRISIKIVDNGHGMDAAFVHDKLGEPWAKEDPYATGSGLSVHLAYSIIDLMGGEMQITSSAGGGCTVELEVPVPRRVLSRPSSPNMSKSDAPDSASPDPAHPSAHPDEFVSHRKVALAGFYGSERLRRLGEALSRQYKKLGCELVELEEAELVVADGWLEEQDQGIEMLQKTKTDDIVFLVSPDYEASHPVREAEKSLNKAVRRFKKPATPSILRETLLPHHSDVISAEVTTSHGTKGTFVNSPDEVDSHGHGHGHARKHGHGHNHGHVHNRGHGHSHSHSHAERHKAKFDEAALSKPSSHSSSGFFQRGFSTLWKPMGMPVEDAVACLCLGDYFSARRRGVSGGGSAHAPGDGTPGSSSHEHESVEAETDGTGTSNPASSGLSSSATTPLDTANSDGHEDHVDLFAIVSGGGGGAIADADADADVGVNVNVGVDVDAGAGEGDADDTCSDSDSTEAEAEPETIKVLVVEDNMVNRKILVKILSSKLGVEVHEAEDGHVAVERFKDFTRPLIVLLDINMPRMDGYQACAEMRAIEKELAARGKSQIIAVTALSGEAERRRGLVESGFDQWHTKPCGKVAIQQMVSEARDLLLRVRST